MGYISTFAGSGWSTYGGDGGAATSAGMESPVHAVSDAAGNVYITDSGADVVRKVDTTGTISRFAGIVNSAGFSGDGGAATAAQLNSPSGLAIGPDGSVYIADFVNGRIRKVSPAGVITTVAGTGYGDGNGGDGDGGPATAGNLSPFALAFDSAGNLYVSDWYAHRVRRINTSGIITTVAGSGAPSNPGYSGDGGAATAAKLHSPRGITADHDGNLFIADTSNGVVRKVDAGGTITTYAGHHTPTCPLGGIANRGDGLIATDEKVQLGPYWVSIDDAGVLYISDYVESRVRTVDPASRVIGTIAGSGDYLCNGDFGFAGDDGPAWDALLRFPYGTSIDNDGNLLIVDRGNYRARVVWNARSVWPSSVETRVPNASELDHCRRCATPWPVDAGSGNFYETFNDLTIPGRSPALDASRTYSSLDAAYNGPFGYGWSSTYDTHLELGPLSGPSPVNVRQENGAYVSFVWNGSQYVAPPRVLATLVKNGDGSYTFTRRQREQLIFDGSGRLIKHIARNGFAGSPNPMVAAAYTTTIAWNGSQLATVTDAAGRTLTFTYGGNAKIAAITDSTGRSVAYGYDPANNLTDVTDAAGGNTHFTYDGNHRLLTIRDPRGNTVRTNTYDAYGRTLTQSDALNRTHTMDYTSIPGSTKVTDPKGNVRVLQFSHNVVFAETKGYGTPSAATWTYTYDLATLGVATMTDPNGHTTTFTWHPSGNPLTRTDALNHQTSWTYNASGEPLTVTDAKSVTTTSTYDAAGNLTSTSTPLVQVPGQMQTTTFTYADAAHPGDLTKITDPRGKDWQFSYAPITGDLSSEITPLGDTTTFTYNTRGQRLTMVSTAGNVVGGNPAAHTPGRIPTTRSVIRRA
jgi:YD repeat-containing protein